MNHVLVGFCGELVVYLEAISDFANLTDIGRNVKYLIRSALEKKKK